MKPEIARMWAGMLKSQKTEEKSPLEILADMYRRIEGGCKWVFSPEGKYLSSVGQSESDLLANINEWIGDEAFQLLHPPTMRDVIERAYGVNEGDEWKKDSEALGIVPKTDSICFVLGASPVKIGLSRGPKKESYNVDNPLAFTYDELAELLENVYVQDKV